MPRAYALITEETEETPETIKFGWPLTLADWILSMQGVSTEDRSPAELQATFDSLLHPAIEVLGYRLSEAQHHVAREAAYTLYIDDVAVYYEGPETDDEYEIREWVATRVQDNTIKHALLDMLVEHDKDLDAPGLLEQIHRQIDEVD